MSIYLQFDSSARSMPYILKQIGSDIVWVPNDNYPNSTSNLSPLNIIPYQTNYNLVQSPTRYRVFYREINTPINKRTISFLEHCKEKPVNLSYSVENCTVIVPSSAVVARIDPISGAISYVGVVNEPYLYVRVFPITDAEGNIISSNNPAADGATFMIWHDKNIHGEVNQATVTPTDPPDPDVSYIPGPLPPLNFPERPVVTTPTTNLTQVRWLIYKTCMASVMRLDLGAQEWQIRIYDRYGNDVIASETDIGPGGNIGFPADIIDPTTIPPTRKSPPNINPDVQTTLLLGIKPLYIT